MGYKFCRKCNRIVLTKVLPGGYKQISRMGIPIKRRKIIHRIEDGGCGEEWYTYEIPENYVSGLPEGTRRTPDPNMPDTI